MKELLEEGNLGDGLRVMSSCNVADIEGGEIERVSALWDTGNSLCCISKRIIEKLNLSKVADCVVEISGEKVDRPVYAIDISFDNGLTFKKVFASEYTTSNFDINIGMEIIKFGDFDLTCKNGRYRMKFVCDKDVYDDCYTLIYD